MNPSISADDLWPLVLKLSLDERIRLARMALCMTGAKVPPDASLYQALPPSPEEFAPQEDLLAWDAEGWDEFDETR